jgi:hypothetical protein
LQNSIILKDDNSHPEGTNYDDNYYHDNDNDDNRVKHFTTKLLYIKKLFLLVYNKGAPTQK